MRIDGRTSDRVDAYRRTRRDRRRTTASGSRGARVMMPRPPIPPSPGARSPRRLRPWLSACGGRLRRRRRRRRRGSDGVGDVTSLRVLDYYNNEPDKTVSAACLDACGKANGRDDPARGGARRHADPEGAAAELVQDAAGRPDARQPRSAADRRDRRARRRSTSSACPPTATAKGVVDASTYEGKLYGLQPITNTIGAVLQQGHPRQGRRHAADDLGRAARPRRRS